MFVWMYNFYVEIEDTENKKDIIENIMKVWCVRKWLNKKRILKEKNEGV